MDRQQCCSCLVCCLIASTAEQHSLQFSAPQYSVVLVPFSSVQYSLVYHVQYCSVPSKHAGSNLHLVQINLEALARSGPDDSCTLTQTGSIWPKPDTVGQNRIRSRLVFHNMIGAICGRMQLSLKAGNW